VIEELRIRDLGVIREAELTLHPGLTVITGETGAGKTMLLTGIDLIRGGRPDATRVRPGAARAHVEAVIAVPLNGEVATIVAELEIELDDDALILGRTVPAEGRARALAGGRAVPSSTLSDLTAGLIAVHGQGDQQRLTRSDTQRQILDRVGAELISGQLDRYHTLLAQLRTARAALHESLTSGAQREAEAQQLQHILGDHDTLAPKPGEAAELAAQALRLSHAEALREAAHQAHEALSGDSDEVDVGALVASARRVLDHEREHDAALGVLADRLSELSAQVTDVASELASYAASIDSDPARLESVQQRRLSLTTFERRHGVVLDEFVDLVPGMRVRLDELNEGDGRAVRLAAEVEGLLEEIAPVAEGLHDARSVTARDLGERVGSELTALAMPQARVEWRIDVQVGTDGEEGAVVLSDGTSAVLGSHGIDEVALLLASHREAPLQPLARAASGGELSRVMLAIEVVLSGLDPIPTMVFDEVDAGVGGRAAVEVGRRLAELARTTQVLVVTHLAQVAAFADRHLVVVRSSDTDDVTSSDVTAVEGETRVRELARMLAGFEDSASAAEHARELMQMADEQRKQMT